MTYQMIIFNQTQQVMRCHVNRFNVLAKIDLVALIPPRRHSGI